MGEKRGSKRKALKETLEILNEAEWEKEGRPDIKEHSCKYYRDVFCQLRYTLARHFNLAPIMSVFPCHLCYYLFHIARLKFDARKSQKKHEFGRIELELLGELAGAAEIFSEISLSKPGCSKNENRTRKQAASYLEKRNLIITRSAITQTGRKKETFSQLARFTIFGALIAGKFDDKKAQNMPKPGRPLGLFLDYRRALVKEKERLYRFADPREKPKGVTGATTAMSLLEILKQLSTVNQFIDASSSPLLKKETTSKDSVTQSP